MHKRGQRKREKTRENERKREKKEEEPLMIERRSAVQVSREKNLPLLASSESGGKARRKRKKFVQRAKQQDKPRTSTVTCCIRIQCTMLEPGNNSVRLLQQTKQYNTGGRRDIAQSGPSGGRHTDTLTHGRHHQGATRKTPPRPSERREQGGRNPKHRRMSSSTAKADCRRRHQHLTELGGGQEGD